jgi:hypothetical protein
MKAWEKFAEALKLTEEMEKTYFKIREVFQREGWTQEDVEEPPYYPSDVMTLYRQFRPLIQEIEQTIRDYGFNVDGNEVKDYIKGKLSYIDDITPLRK